MKESLAQNQDPQNTDHNVLIQYSDEIGLRVPISHSELDTLVGRLMQMCDLTGDKEQRKALKDTIKLTCRDWLDQVYDMKGYDKWTGVKEGATIFTVIADGKKHDLPNGTSYKSTTPDTNGTSI